MKLFKKMKDGGPDSHVTGYFLIEWKGLFSIAILHFAKGTREAYHTHAFNALTFWLRGEVIEEFPDGRAERWHAGQIKYTPRGLCHRVRGIKDAWTLSLRGPWAETWKEYLPGEDRWVTLTNGRKVVV